MIKNSKVFGILRSFSNEEHKEFSKFLDSPFFVKRSKLKQLYILLVKQYKHKDFRNIDALTLYKKLFPVEYKKRGYSDSTMRFSLNALYHAAEEFIAVRSFMNKGLLRNEVLREELLVRGLYESFQNNLANADRNSETEFSSASSYLLKYNIEQDKFNFINTLHGPKIKRRKKDNPDNIILATKNLYNFFIIEITGVVDTYVKYCKQKNIPINNEYLDAIYGIINVEEGLKFIKTVADKKFPDKLEIIEIFLAKYKAFSNMNDEKHYDDFKRLLISKAMFIEPDYRYHFFTRLLDYCVLKRSFNPGVKKYGTELISVYKLIIENGFYRHSKSKIFPMDLFRNAIVAGVREGEIEWVEEFVEKFKSKLQKDLRKDATYYARGRLAFEKKDFTGAVLSFGKIKDEYSRFNVDKKAYTLMSLYESGDLDEALKGLDSYRHYLGNSDHIQSRVKHNHKRFVYFLGKLINEQVKLGKNSDGYLRKQIFQENELFAREWLLKKADELIPRKSNKTPHSTNRPKQTSYRV